MNFMSHHDKHRARTPRDTRGHREKSMRNGGWILAALLAIGCGNEHLNTTPTLTSGGGNAPSGAGGSTATGASDGAVVNVELRGQEQLVFANGARIHIERFVVNFGAVSLVHDLANPNGSDVAVPGGSLPVVGTEAESTLGNIVIGRDKFEGGAFEGLRLELSPPNVPATADPSASTLFVRGRFMMPSNPSSRKDDAKISPNPAPIVPANAQSEQGRSEQGLTSNYGITFTFQSRLSEGLLVGLGENLNLGDSVTLVFAARQWFSDDVVSYLSAEALARLRLGVTDNSLLIMGGSGVPVSDAAAEAVGAELENNIVRSIGFEVR